MHSLFNQHSYCTWVYWSHRNADGESDKSFPLSRTKLMLLVHFRELYRDIQPVFSECHVTFVLTGRQHIQRGREGGKWRASGRKEKNDRGMARKQKKRAIPYSLINLNVNCRLMSWRSGMLLGKMKPEENMVPDRCTTEPLNGAVVLSAPSILHTTDLDHHTCCHTVRASSSMWNSGIEVGAAATAATANSLLFLLLLAFFLSLTHTHSFKRIPNLILILLFHLFLFSPAPYPFWVFFCTATPPPTSAHFWAACHCPGPHHHICWYFNT